jgi:heparan-alpha-glucosaminide N-acetyltransferase
MRVSNNPSGRLESINIFRAATMLLMIFVNDFWTLEQVPVWLLHSAAEADYMGLSDVIFPVFLFIVGLSLPFAIGNRIKKGETNRQILLHIFERTFALLLMGIFTVNYENILTEGLLIDKYVWGILMVFAFFLVWNQYPHHSEKLMLFRFLKLSGYILLLLLAVIYKGGDETNTVWMKTHWWGILGLIGWSYLICSVLYLFSQNRLWVIITGWIALVLFNLGDFAGILSNLNDVRDTIWIVGSGSLPAFTLAGVIASMLYQRYYSKDKADIFLVILLVLGIACLLYGFATRPFWGISKIRATPAWLGICTGIGFVTYAIFIWIVEVMALKKWANVLKPAGDATLTCYLIPYVWYAVVTIADFSLPLFLRTGMVGLLKSFVFSIVIILTTGLVNRHGVKLKI